MNRCDCPTELDEARIRLALPQCAPRDRLIVELRFQTGLRISELLGLRVGDVWHGGISLTVLRVSRARLKGGQGVRRRAVKSRTIPLNAQARTALVDYFAAADPERWANPDAPLFVSRKGGGLRAIDRRQGAKIIRKIFLAAGLDPARVWAGHSLRRRFVRRVFDSTKDINVARTALGHRWVTTTQVSLGLDKEEAHAAILKAGEHQEKTAATWETRVGAAQSQLSI